MFYVYMLANHKSGTLYLGHTDDLMQRVETHKSETYGGFSAKYNCKTLVWYELHKTRESAFKRERQMKEWNRGWKIKRIEALNPDWLDMSETITIDDLYDEARLYQP